MHAAEKSPWKYLVLWLRLYFAIHYLASGLNYVIFNFIPDFSHAGRVGPYLHAMADIGFYHVIKYLEVVLGTMLLFNLAVPLALIVMAGRKRHDHLPESFHFPGAPAVVHRDPGAASQRRPVARLRGVLREFLPHQDKAVLVLGRVVAPVTR